MDSVNDIQLRQLRIEWVPREEVHPNKYNPNRMTWHDRQLLRQSVLEDGWTQPIVTLPDGTIVDGEQRWTVAGLELHPRDIQEVLDHMIERRDAGHPISQSVIDRLTYNRDRLAAAIEAGMPAELASITGGLVPITRVDLGDDAHKMLSTIRHNRARGIHNQDAMAVITQDLVELGLDLDDLETRLGMDDEEIRRFLQAAEGQIADLERELEGTAFSQSMRVVSLAEAELRATDPDAYAAYERSRDATQKEAEYQKALREREARLADAVQSATPEGATQIEKERIEKKVAESLPDLPAPPPPTIVKHTIMITPEESAIVTRVFASGLAPGVVAVARFLEQHPEVREAVFSYV